MTTIEPITISLELACSADHAFDTFTQKTEVWWPREHTVSADPKADIVLEPKLGGRLFERTSAGEVHEWGEITTWEPKRRFCYTWHIHWDASDATDIEITFTDTGGASSRVDIVHSGWERLGGDGERWVKRNRAGWDGILPDFKAAAEA